MTVVMATNIVMYSLYYLYIRSWYYKEAGWFHWAG